ncbi:MAG: endonuclease/exonuclease/phosphatase family protein [Acidimicrobiia bacterium]
MPEFTLVSFNCHAGLQARRNGVCAPYDLAGVLRDLDADVIVVQESYAADGERSAAAQVAGELGATVHELTFGRAHLDPWPQVRRDGTGSGAVGLAVISKLPSRAVGRLAVGMVPGDFTPERGALHLEVDVGGTTVDVVGVHLTSRLPYGPPVQMRRLAKQLPSQARPAVVAGDHNFWGPGVSTFMPGWKRTVRGRTWPASRPHSQIDHILVSPQVRALHTEVLPPLGSDHRGVRAVLRVDG